MDQGSTSFIDRLRASPRQWLVWLARAGVAAAVLFAILLVIYIGQPPIIGPPLRRAVDGVAETYGRIYVESPEIYTRQRLVNDRYDQDFWLRSELRRLDEAANTVIGASRSRGFTATVGVPEADGGGADAGAEPPPDAVPDTAAAGEPGPEPGVTFETAFRVRSATRDNIRQMVLENALDDRHDLTGNTVYGLKFDTAVIPGSSTRLKPAVVVEMSVAPFPDDVDAAEILIGPTAGLEMRTGQAEFEVIARHFERWRRNIVERINDYLNDPCAAGLASADQQGPSPSVAPYQAERPDSRLGRAINYVLDVPIYQAERIALAGLSEIDRGMYTFKPEVRTNIPLDIPEPWSDIFHFSFTPAGDGGSGEITVNVEPKWTFFYIFEGPRPANTENLVLHQSCRRPDEGENGFGCVGVREEEAGFFVYVRKDTLAAARTDFDGFVRDLSAAELSRLVERTAPFEQTSLEGTPQARWVAINVGLYRFIERINEIESYSYAAFPRGDVAGVVTDAYADVRVGAGGAAGLGLGATSRGASVAAEPTLINFAGGGGGQRSGERFDFGWAIVRPGLQTPTLASQLVLLSVPAYLDELRLTITKGWLDPDYRLPRGVEWADLDFQDRIERLLRDRDAIVLDVNLPPDYEALDSILGPGASRLGPVINRDALCLHKLPETGGRLVVRAGDDVDIVIPGERLWRSTIVTLGGQAADRIRVLPDMRGIIASFHGVRGTASAEQVPVPLSVWTSQGADWLYDYVEVAPAATPEQAR